MNDDRNLKVDGCPSKENIFGQSALLTNAKYIAKSLLFKIRYIFEGSCLFDESCI